ncbi:TetR/AcrR family transcriptional regulator [Kribbella lupini]|uniref:TetR/AcrR family transcriptional regulator n=1 Tax=Kribbella lupini TaxID=291602 RepID=A0ABN2BQ01_9ACTN
MGRNSDARPKILAAGRDLLARRGYSALGVAEICAAAGVPKGSFYYFFDSKQALAEAVIEDHWVEQRAQWAALLGSDKAPLERLRDLYDATTEVQRRAQKDTGAVTGCLFGNLALELSARDDEIQRRLQEIFDEQITLVAEVVDQAQRDGTIDVPDAREAARSLVAQLEGSVLFAKLRNDPGELDQLWPHTAALLGAKA